MMNGGKKFVVISQEEYERLKGGDTQINVPILNPLKVDMKRSEKEMSNVWSKEELPRDEQIRIFTKELNNLKTRYDNLTRAKPLEVVVKSDGDNKAIQSNETLEDSILQAIPKASKLEAKLLINHLKTQPNIIKWNNAGEVIYRGEVVPGSNITDMIIDSVTNRKRSYVPTMVKSVFLKALAETNVPSKWIKNKEHNEVLHSYKTIKSKNISNTPETKKIKLNWLSST